MPVALPVDAAGRISVKPTLNVQACVWALLAAALFSTAAVIAKFAVTEFHVLQILFFRQLVVFLSCLPTMARAFPDSLKTNQPALHIARLVGAFVALSCGIWAVAVLPLTTAVTLGFAQVFFVALLSRVFLNEALGVHRLGAVLTGFVGVIWVMQPTVGGTVTLYSLIPVVGAIGAAIAVTSVRKLSQTDTTQTLLIYQSVFVGALAAIPLFWFWKTPDLTWLLILLFMGVVATVGQWIGVKALRLGEASVVGTVKYTELVFAALFGFLIFHEMPGTHTVIGASLIVGAALYTLKRESRNPCPDDA